MQVHSRASKIWSLSVRGTRTGSRRMVARNGGGAADLRPSTRLSSNKESNDDDSSIDDT